MRLQRPTTPSMWGTGSIRKEQVYRCMCLSCLFVFFVIRSCMHAIVPLMR